jgi:GNAT superfamily N-acetyltransferase
MFCWQSKLGKSLAWWKLALTANSTIGLICVAKEYRHKGVGADLVKPCERLVVDTWKDDMLFAEVEESNVPVATGDGGARSEPQHHLLSLAAPANIGRCCWQEFQS